MKQYIYLSIGLVAIVYGLTTLISQSFIDTGQEDILQAQLTEIANQNNKMESNSNLIMERPVITMKTSKGDITIELFSDLSPVTVDYILGFVKDGLYEGTLFHRVIEDFMIQGGDPLTKDPANQSRFGTGGPDFRFDDEFNDEPLVEGSFAMANAGPNTNGSQFFIVTAESTPWLNGAHTNIGRVIGGMDVVKSIESVETGKNDLPVEDVRIEAVEIVRE